MEEYIRVTLFRSLRELLINVAKHARVRAARVRIEPNDGVARVIVEDDGIGFDQAASADEPGQGGFGLFSIRERLRHLGCRFEIRSAPGQGTAITLEVPVCV